MFWRRKKIVYFKIPVSFFFERNGKKKCFWFFSPKYQRRKKSFYWIKNIFFLYFFVFSLKAKRKEVSFSRRLSETNELSNGMVPLSQKGFSVQYVCVCYLYIGTTVWNSNNLLGAVWLINFAWRSALGFSSFGFITTRPRSANLQVCQKTKTILHADNFFFLSMWPLCQSRLRV